MCVCVRERYFGHKSIEIIASQTKLQLFGLMLGLLLSLSYCLYCYRKGESPHTGNSAAQLQYPLTAQSTIFLFQTKPQLPHCWFSSPFSDALSCFFFFFPSVSSQGCGFLTTLSAQEVCCGKTGPCHCFHSWQRATELNLTPITRLQSLKILSSTFREAWFNSPELFIHCHVNILMSAVKFTMWRSQPRRKRPKPIS